SCGAMVGVGGAAEGGGDPATPDRVTAPVAAHAVGVFAVPLPPQGREAPEVVAIGLAHIPRLGDELRTGYHRILTDEVKECGDLVEPALLAAQCRRKVEAEAVDGHLGNPVPKRVLDQLKRDRVPGVQSTTG